MKRFGWIADIYYYLAALVGLGFLLTGLAVGLLGVAQGALPDLYWDGPCEPEDYCQTRSQVREDGWANALGGGIAAGIGAPVLVWHLRQARRDNGQ